MKESQERKTLLDEVFRIYRNAAIGMSATVIAASAVVLLNIEDLHFPAALNLVNIVLFGASLVIVSDRQKTRFFGRAPDLGGEERG